MTASAPNGPLPRLKFSRVDVLPPMPVAARAPQAIPSYPTGETSCQGCGHDCADFELVFGYCGTCRQPQRNDR